MINLAASEHTNPILIQLRNESIFCSASALIQIMVNLVYLAKYIVKLDESKFHYMMFALLLGC